jgi:fatty-acyl-CoA synthase
MTGANRLLIGLGWSSIVLLAWFRHGARAVALERSQALEMSVLLAATAYALFIPFKGELGLVDTVVLVTLFGLYTWATSRAPAEEPHLVGPAATIGTLGIAARRMATLLRGRYGVRPGDRIALLSENRLEYPELQLAAARLGAILACQNWRQSAPELEHCIRLVAPRLVVVSERHLDRLAAIDHGVPVTVVLGDEYEALLDGASAAALPDAAQPEDGLVILYTSGTTGLPKAAVISHRAMIARSVIARTDQNFFPDRTFVA